MSEPGEPEADGDLSRYEHSGIEERHGAVPRWLLGVYLAMGAWMVYYLVQYWSDKG